ncbi:hypothetical protein DFP72DRAFT_1044293 [Ephemerocybe angulata]|uniref:ABM domain-containing protein n=1 Tax=Ephemerocybe angulata TaxID=980116 RepID=A0A8H6M6B9_9AGAR|nr:hypothetical protein DFP72DRAFT_1044293 [Tulosesus angulatus]
MSLCVEVASFQASDALLSDPSLVKGASDIISKAEGFKSAYSGFQTEDGKTVYIVLVWESYDLHEKARADPIYAELGAQMKDTLIGPGPYSLEFTVMKDFTISLEAPNTEITYYKIKEGKTKEELTSQFDNMNGIFGSQGFTGAHPPAAYGELIEMPGTFLAISGWDRAEDHAAVAGSEVALPEGCQAACSR